MTHHQSLAPELLTRKQKERVAAADNLLLRIVEDFDPEKVTRQELIQELVKLTSDRDTPYGATTSYTEAYLDSEIGILVRQDFLERFEDTPGVYRITEAGRQHVDKIS